MKWIVKKLIFMGIAIFLAGIMLSFSSLATAVGGDMFVEIDRISDYVINSVRNCTTEGEMVEMSVQLLEREDFVVRVWVEGGTDVMWESANGLTCLIDCSLTDVSNTSATPTELGNKSSFQGGIIGIPAGPVSPSRMLPSMFFGNTPSNSNLKVLALSPYENYDFAGSLDPLSGFLWQGEGDRLASLAGAGAMCDFYQDGEVTFEKLTNWNQYSVVLVLCHGRASGSEAGIQLPRRYFYRSDNDKDPMWNQVKGDLIDVKAVAGQYEDRIQLKASFFTNHLSSLPNNFIYMAACHVMNSSNYATALRNKGAALVIGYSGSTGVHSTVMNGLVDILSKPWATTTDIMAKENIGSGYDGEWDDPTGEPKGKFKAYVKFGSENTTLLHNVDYTQCSLDPAFGSVVVGNMRQFSVSLTPDDATNYYLKTVTVVNPAIATTSIARNGGKPRTIMPKGISVGYTPITLEMETFKQGQIQTVALTSHLVVKTSSQQLVDFYANRDGNYLAHHVYIGVPPAAPSLPAVSGTYGGMWQYTSLIGGDRLAQPYYVTAMRKNDVVKNGNETLRAEIISTPNHPDYAISGYEWYKCNVNGVRTGGCLSTASSLTINENLTANTYYYHCDISVSVDGIPMPIITTNPIPLKVYASILGDANGSGTVNAGDAAHILRWIVKLDSMEDCLRINADADVDGRITAADAAAILRYIVRLGTLPPGGSKAPAQSKPDLSSKENALNGSKAGAHPEYTLYGVPSLFTRNGVNLVKYDVYLDSTGGNKLSALQVDVLWDPTKLTYDSGPEGGAKVSNSMYTFATAKGNGLTLPSDNNVFTVYFTVNVGVSPQESLQLAFGNPLLRLVTLGEGWIDPESYDFITKNGNFYYTGSDVISDDYGNTFANAETWALAAGTTNSKSGMMEVAGDKDMFQFTAPYSGNYTFYTTGPVDTRGTLYNSSQTQLAYHDDIAFPSNCNFQIVYTLTAGQVYYLEVKAWNPNIFNPYVLNIVVPDDYGNTFATAYNWTLNAGTTNAKSGKIDVAYDIDMFQFTAPTTGSYTFYSTSAIDTTGTLYNSAQTQLTFNDDGGANYNFQITYSLTAGQVYYLAVKGYSTNIGDYTVHVQVPANPDDYGNTFATAFNWALTAGTTNSKNGSIEVSGDIDMFKFTAPTTGSYSLYSAGTTDTTGTLYNSGQTQLAFDDDSGGSRQFRITYSLTAGQIYYLAVKAYSSNIGAYTLNIQVPGTATPTPIPAKSSIAARSNQTMAIKANGTVWAWGNNGNGQLGDGTTTNRAAPVQVSGLSDVVSITSGVHTMALKSNGTVWASGWNWFGQLGDGTTTERHTPVQVSGLTDVVSITAGHYHSFAIKSNGTVWAWGRNDFGQLGNGTTTNRSTPGQVSGLSNVIALAAGTDHTVALKSDGTVWTWGLNDYGQLGDGTTTNRSVPTQVSGLTNVSSISAGYSHSVAVKADGTVWTWGKNSDGQLGDNTLTNRYAPVQVSGLSGVVTVSAGWNHTIAIKANGTVWAWGYNYFGQLGDGTTTTRKLPVQVSGLSNVVAVVAGDYHTMALKADGTLWSWGENGYGQLGDGTTTTRLIPTQVSGFIAEVQTRSGSGIVDFEALLAAANVEPDPASENPQPEKDIEDSKGNVPPPAPTASPVPVLESRME